MIDRYAERRARRLPEYSPRGARGRIALVLAVALALASALGVGCTSSSTSDPGDASGGGTDGSVAPDDAGSCGLPAPAGSGSYGGWYLPDQLPSGACSMPGCSATVRVNPCCNEPNTPELKQYTCTCSAGTWSCQLVSQGAGYCGDGSAASYVGDPGCT